MNSFLLKRLTVLASILFFTNFAANLQAQIAVTVTNPNNANPTLSSNYVSLFAALTALNSSVSINGPIELNLAASSTEIAPAGGFVILPLTGTSATNTITIKQAGAGNFPVLLASPAHTAGSRGDAVIKLLGVDFLTINGIAIQENVANTVYTLVSNTATEFGIALMYFNNSNGCKNITIKNCNITLQRAYVNSVGIYSNVRHSATTPQTTADIVNVNGANENITIQSNDISNVASPIVFVGSTSAINMISGLTIGGSTNTGNTISNFGNNLASTASFVSVSGTCFGIYVNNYLSKTISHNNISSANLATSVAVRSIYADFTGSPNTVFITDIVNNTISISNSNAATIMRAIESAGGFNQATLNINNNTVNNTLLAGAFTAIANTGIYNTLNINNNTILGINHTASTGAFTAISNSGAVTANININNNKLGNETADLITYNVGNSAALIGINNIGGASGATLSISNNNFQGIVSNANSTHTNTLIVNSAAVNTQIINANTFNNLIIRTSGSVTFISNTSSVPADGIQTVSNNLIATQFSKIVSGGTLSFFSSSAASQAGSSINHNANNFSNVTVIGATTITAWANSDGGTVNKSVTNNIFTNFTGGTSPITLISMNYGGASGGLGNVISNNTIHTITNGGSIVGITLGSSGANNSVFNNLIHNLQSTGASAVSGIVSSSSANGNIYRNKIYNLSATNASGTVNGIFVNSGSVHNVYNNKIADLRTPAANAANPINGINITGGTVSNVYYNTIYLNANSTGALFGSAAMYNSTSVNVTLRNNIFVNLSQTNGANGRAAVYRRSTATLTSYNNLSNNNLFYIGVASSTRVIYFDGTNSDITLNSFQVRVAPRDINSISEEPPFLSLDGANSSFLNINPTVNTGIESGAVNITVITDDFDGDIRQGNPGYSGFGNAPDIGADEFDSQSQACSGMPTAGAIEINTPIPICNSGSADLNLIGATGDGGISYLWKWSNISGGPYTSAGNGTTENTGAISATRYYVCDVICSVSGQIATTAEIAVQVLDAPVASFTYQEIPDVSGVGFAAPNFTSATYLWIFGDGNTSTVQNPIHGYDGNGGTFNVTLIMSNFCGADTTSQIIMVNPSSTENIGSAPVIKLYPNPTQQFISIDFENPMSDFQITCYKANGQMVWVKNNIQIDNSSISFDVSDLASGYYGFKISNNKFTKTLFWIKE